VSCYRVILAEKANHSIACLCRVLGLARAGYYAWSRRQPARRSQTEAALSAQIRTIHQQSRATYSASRMRAELQAQGVRCGRKRIARLMRHAGLVGCHRRRRRTLTRRDSQALPAPDLVERNFQATGPTQLWVADLSYLATGEGWLYLAVILDAFSRQVVGWAMASYLRAELVIAALEFARWRRQADRGLVHHSDQGSQSTALACGQHLQQAGLVASMGSAVAAYDNALVEAFFATLKSELASTQPWPTRQAARTAVFDYLECWYNPRRRHSALDYLSPIDYERRWQHEPAAQCPTVHSTGVTSSAIIMLRSIAPAQSRCKPRLSGVLISLIAFLLALWDSRER
jgi:putative transposase